MFPSPKYMPGLNWLDGSPRRFKTYVGNRISTIVDLIPPDKWRHVRSADNPADCASRGLYPSMLRDHSLWWNGPTWLKEPRSSWPEKLPLPLNQPEVEEKEISLHILTQDLTPIIPVDKFSSFDHHGMDNSFHSKLPNKEYFRMSQDSSHNHGITSSGKPLDQGHSGYSL